MRTCRIENILVVTLEVYNRYSGGKLLMLRIKSIVFAVLSFTLILQSISAQKSASDAKVEEMPKWQSRGLPGPGHAALKPLVGSWRVRMNFYATFGRSPDLPPLVSEGMCRREWVAGGRYLEDMTEGTTPGAPYWRKGWLGYSNMDRRYEWITIDAVNSNMMIYAGAPGSGSKMPIIMSGVFTDQGVAGEQYAGKAVGMRTVIKLESNDSHILELYFTPPGKPEVLATRQIYTRANQ
jgi:hypothetical protein